MTLEEFETLPKDEDGYRHVEYDGDPYKSRRVHVTGLGRPFMDLWTTTPGEYGSIRRYLSEVRAPRG